MSKYAFQSFDDILEQERTLYFWKDTSLESYLQNAFGPGTAGHELYHKGIGIGSSAEAFAALEEDEGAYLSEWNVF